MSSPPQVVGAYSTEIKRQDIYNSTTKHTIQGGSSLKRTTQLISSCTGLAVRMSFTTDPKRDLDAMGNPLSHSHYEKQKSKFSVGRPCA